MADRELNDQILKGGLAQPIAAPQRVDVVSALDDHAGIAEP